MFYIYTIVGLEKLRFLKMNDATYHKQKIRAYNQLKRRRFFNYYVNCRRCRIAILLLHQCVSSSCTCFPVAVLSKLVIYSQRYTQGIDGTNRYIHITSNLALMTG